MYKYLYTLIACLLLQHPSLQAQETTNNKDFCALEVNVAPTTFDNPAFEWGFNLVTSFRILDNVQFHKLELAYVKGDKRGGKFVYHSKEHEQIIINPKDDLREVVLDVCFWGIQQPNRNQLITAPPSKMDSIQSIQEVFIDVLQSNSHYTKQKIEAPHLIIAELKGSPDAIRPHYIFILWDAAKKSSPPPFLQNNTRILNYQIIEFEIKDFRLHEFFYIDISNSKNKRQLIDRLKSKTEALEANDDRYTLYLSNSNNPYIAKNKKEKKKLIKRVRILEPDFPDPGADIGIIKRQINKQRIIKEGNKAIFHFYLSDSFYQTNQVGAATDEQQANLFIEKLLAPYKNHANLEVFIYLENDQKQFSRIRYVFDD